MASQEKPLSDQSRVMGRQTHIGRETLSTETRDPELPTDRGVTMNNRETAPDALGLAMDKPPLDLEAVDAGNPVLVRPVTAKDIQEMNGGTLLPPKEGPDPLQGTNVGLPVANQETPLGDQSRTMGRQTHIGRESLSTETQDPELPTDRGVTMNNRETAPDTMGLAMDKPPLDLEAEDTGTPVLARPVTAKDIQET